MGRADLGPGANGSQRLREHGWIGRADGIREVTNRLTQHRFNKLLACTGKITAAHTLALTPANNVASVPLKGWHWFGAGGQSGPARLSVAPAKRPN